MGESRSKKICKDITEMVGDTPMVYLNSIGKDIHAKIACKVEYFGPTCSVKDRIGWAMIEDAEKKGLIQPGKTVVIEPTSGNTGITLAALCAARGYKMVLVMADGYSVERRAIARALGAEVVLTDTKLGAEEVIDRCTKLLEWIPNSFAPMQFANPANPQTHYENTGREIWEQTEGKVDICVFGSGTGGTITGVGRYLKER
ncbi:Protein CYSL-2 [Aphelenchoides avenae]|nr:Protein CYSL-2 [Aphelenchus avenae]